MPRARKFQVGDVALWSKPIAGVEGVTHMQYFAVIVDYRTYPTGKGEYRVIRVLHPSNGAPFGEPVWEQPDRLTPLEYPKRITVARVLKANARMEQRGCECMCCAHEAIERKDIRKDGTFVWEPEQQHGD